MTHQNTLALRLNILQNVFLTITIQVIISKCRYAHSISPSLPLYKEGVYWTSKVWEKIIFKKYRMSAELIFFFGVFRPTRGFFTRMETSPLPVKDCKFCLMLGTYGHWAVRLRVEQAGKSVYNVQYRGPVTLTPIAERLAVDLSLHVFTT